MKYFVLMVINIAIIGGCKMNYREKIEILNRENFDFYRGMTIYYRSPGSEINTSVYFINMNDRNCGPYVITIQENEGVVKSISDHLITDCEGYLDESTIDSTFNRFLGLNVGYLKVDTIGNVYINPYEGAEATLLRVAANGSGIDLNSYTLIEDNWFARK